METEIIKYIFEQYGSDATVLIILFYFANYYNKEITSLRNQLSDAQKTINTKETEAEKKNSTILRAVLDMQKNNSEKIEEVVKNNTIAFQGVSHSLEKLTARIIHLEETINKGGTK